MTPGRVDSALPAYTMGIGVVPCLWRIARGLVRQLPWLWLPKKHFPRQWCRSPTCQHYEFSSNDASCERHMPHCLETEGAEISASNSYAVPAARRNPEQTMRRPCSAAGDTPSAEIAASSPSFTAAPPPAGTLLFLAILLLVLALRRRRRRPQPCSP